MRTKEKFMSFFCKENKYGTDYNKDDNNECLYNDDFEKELENYHKNLENENRDFEESLRLENSNENKNLNGGVIEEISQQEAIFNLISGNEYSSCVEKTEPNYLKKNKYKSIHCNFCLKRTGDLLKDVYLEINYPEGQTEFTQNQKLAILNLRIFLEIGGSLITKGLLIGFYFQMLCDDKNIIETEDGWQIPIMNFKTFNINKDVKLKNDLDGLSLVSMRYHEVRFFIESDDLTLENCKLKLIQNLILLDQTPRKELAMAKLQYLFIESTFSIEKELYFKNKKITDLTKMIAIYFINENSDNYFDSYIDYPEIKSFTISSIDEYSNSQKMVFEGDDILTMELFGIKIYFIPLSKEFRNFEALFKTFSNPNMEFLLNGYMTKEDTYFNLETFNSIENYQPYYIYFTFNCIRMMSGMGMKSFSG